MPITSAPVLTADQLATGLAYAACRQHITAVLAAQDADLQLAKMLPHYQESEARMNALTPTVAVLPELQAAL